MVANGDGGCMRKGLSRSGELLEGLQEALRLTNETIGILDSMGASADIAAHLDLAANRMVGEMEKCMRGLPAATNRLRS